VHIRIERIRDIMTMRYINLLFTYLLTHLRSV